MYKFYYLAAALISTQASSLTATQDNCFLNITPEQEKCLEEFLAKYDKRESNNKPVILTAREKFLVFMKLQRSRL